MGSGIKTQKSYQSVYPKEEFLKKIIVLSGTKGAKFTAPLVFVCHETAEKAMEADKKGNADIEVVAPVAEKIEETEEIKCYTLPGGKMAKIIHKGSYEKCGPTYNKVFVWIEKNGKKIVGPIREGYLNDPREVGLEEALTEIYIPIR